MQATPYSSSKGLALAHRTSPLDELMQRLAIGDESAIAPLYQMLWPVLLRFVTARASSEADAPDIAQRALLKLIEQSHLYDASRSAMAWALSIAYWEWRSVEKARLRARWQSPEEFELVDSAASPEQALQEEELTQIATTLLSQLSSEERALLLDDAQLPRALEELSPAARRKRKQRLLSRLRAAVNLILSPNKANT